ncbi:hypothetical protein MOE35_18455 [Bacillus atrophaeus]|uniref:hypothetical protein n=2 Tax=Bacillus atrophaeus TaxID=1452 RepID=UPI00227E8A8D|nr:hypothetical protein [Bacillus atrophaeus]MCY8969620.1 hypothetical protein [Bacillus atrophaeus]
MKENERIQYLLEMLNCAIQYNDPDSYNEVTSELKQSLFAPKAFDTKTAEKIVKSQEEYRANKIKDDLLSIVDELLKYKFTDEIGLPLHHASPFQQLAEIANYYIDTDRYFARDGSKIIESLKGYDKAETHEVKDFKINTNVSNEAIADLLLKTINEAVKEGRLVSVNSQRFQDKDDDGKFFNAEYIFRVKIPFPEGDLNSAKITDLGINSQIITGTIKTSEI